MVEERWFADVDVSSFANCFTVGRRWSFENRGRDSRSDLRSLHHLAA